MCRSGCKTKDHESWGACARAANMKIAYCGVGGLDATKQKLWDAELGLYRQAVADGLDPKGTTTQAVREAYTEAEAS